MRPSLNIRIRESFDCLYSLVNSIHLSSIVKNTMKVALVVFSAMAVANMPSVIANSPHREALAQGRNCSDYCSQIEYPTNSQVSLRADAMGNIQDCMNLCENPPASRRRSQARRNRTITLEQSNSGSLLLQPGETITRQRAGRNRTTTTT